MTRFAVSLLRVASLIALGSASPFAGAQTLIDQNRALVGNVNPGDMPGFPVTINQPGHYKLSGPLSVPAGVAGIVIAAPNVTLDLNGYTISGPNTCTQNAATKQVSCTQALNAAITGVSSTGRNTLVRNGLVRGFAGSGVTLDQNSRAEQIQASENTSEGVRVAGGEIVNSMAELNGSGGLIVGPGRVMGSRAMNNGGFAIVAALVVDCMSIGNVVGAQGVSMRDSIVRQNKYDLMGLSTSLGGNLVGDLPW